MKSDKPAVPFPDMARDIMVILRTRCGCVRRMRIPISYVKSASFLVALDMPQRGRFLDSTRPIKEKMPTREFRLTGRRGRCPLYEEVE